MKRSFLRSGWRKVVYGALAGAIVASAPTWAIGYANPDSENTAPEKFWPSEFGADDQRGAANRLTPEKTIAAAKLVKGGQIYFSPLRLKGATGSPDNPIAVR